MARPWAGTIRRVRVAPSASRPEADRMNGVLQTVTALIYYRLFIAGDQPSPELADRAGAAAAAAAHAGVFTSAPS